ncbi:unnamed protein product [Prunus armeniaca]
MQDNRAVGIGGSFSGPLQTDPEAIETARGRQLHFFLLAPSFEDLPDWNNEIVFVHEFISVA